MTPPPGFRLLVDLTHLWPHGLSGGIKPALRELLRWLGDHEPGLTCVLVVNPEQDPEAATWARPVDRVVRRADAPPDLAAREQCDVVYCPFGITDWAWPGIPTVTLMVDLLHRDFPETLQPVDIEHREKCLVTALERTDVFQVISDYTAGQLCRHTGIGAERVLRTYLPVQHRLGNAPTVPAAGIPYFFFPANAWLHKNHETLLIAYALYRHHAGPAAWRLVLTGHASDAMARLQRRADTLGVVDTVDFLGYVDDAHLARLWDAAAALVFPSLHEGFGLPLLEAMTRRVPILAGRTTAIPEVAGDAALLVDARSPRELAEGLRLIATEPARRADLVARGLARAATFSADREFGRLRDTFRALAGRPARPWHCGYYAIDGLVTPGATFGLPALAEPATLQLATRPLGVARQLEIWSGTTCLARAAVPGDGPGRVEVAIPAATRAVTLRVPDASRLSPTDPRTHGLLLASLHLRRADGTAADLLAT